MEPKWFGPFQFDRENLKKIPSEAGVYKILQKPFYSRYHGQTDVLKIGISEKNLRTELENHLSRHDVANRLKRITNQNEVSAMFIYSLFSDAQDVRKIESQLLREFEEEHWDLPLLNSQRGYKKRGDDKHYRQSV